MSIVIEEADESAFWLEILIEAGIIPENKLSSLYNEAIELTKITSVSRQSLKINNNSKD